MGQVPFVPERVLRFFMSKLLSSILENPEYNTPWQDGKPCRLCRKVPKIEHFTEPDHVETNRSSRVDCNNGDIDETYCLKCWRTLVFTTYTRYEKIKPKNFKG